MSSQDSGKIVEAEVKVWIISLIGTWLITSQFSGFWGEPIMLIHGVLVTIISYILAVVLPIKAMDYMRGGSDWD